MSETRREDQLRSLLLDKGVGAVQWLARRTGLASQTGFNELDLPVTDPDLDAEVHAMPQNPELTDFTHNTLDELDEMVDGLADAILGTLPPAALMQLMGLPTDSLPRFNRSKQARDLIFLNPEGPVSDK